MTVPGIDMKQLRNMRAEVKARKEARHVVAVFLLLFFAIEEAVLGGSLLSARMRKCSWWYRR